MPAPRPADGSTTGLVRGEPLPVEVLPAPGEGVIDAGAIGEGKSTLVIDPLTADGPPTPYDVQFMFGHNHRTLHERQVVRARGFAGQPGIRDGVAVLAGPPKDCPALDHLSALTARGCGALARELHCAGCPVRSACHWSNQFDADRLARVHTFVAPLAYLAAWPTMVSDLCDRLGLRRPFVVIDEAQVPITTGPNVLKLSDLRMLSTVIDAMAGGSGPASDVWGHALARLSDPDDDLVGLSAPVAPVWFDRDVQQTGVAMFGDRFHCNLREARAAIRGGARRLIHGDVQYTLRPDLSRAGVLLSGAGLDAEAVRRFYNIGTVRYLFPPTPLVHPGSELFVIRSTEGSARHFPANAGRIVHLGSRLAMRLREECRHTIFVTRKRFLADVTALLEEEFAARGITAQLVTTDFDQVVGREADFVPVVTYGSTGINALSAYDAAICLNAYNVRPDVLGSVVSTMALPGEALSTRVVELAGRRRAVPLGRDGRRAEVRALVDHVHWLLEGAVAEQAAGRVRYTVRPRLVLFFQRGPLSVPATDLGTVAGAMAHFDIPRHRDEQVQRTREIVQAARASGAATISEAARVTGYSRRTVRRYWEPGP